MSQPILKINDLTKRYLDITALNQVNLEIIPGKIVGLLGPNGSGKTTMIKIINDLLHDYSGEVLISGHAPGVESKQLISFLPDRPHLPVWMKTRQCIDYFQDFYIDFNAEKARKMLEEMQIPWQRKVAQLSKGMQEKLMLTLIMSRRAKLYILDEPIAGVDPASRDFILRTILNNFDQESSILLSTHLISDVEAILDRVIFLKNGSVILQEDTENIRTRENKSVDQLFREMFAC